MEARPALLVDELDALEPGWSVETSAGDRSSLINEGKVGEILSPANHAAYLERPAPEGTAVLSAVLDPGTDVSASWGPGIAIAFPDRTVKFNLRPGKGGFGVWDGAGERVDDGRHDMSQAWELRLYLQPDRILARPARGARCIHGRLARGLRAGPRQHAPAFAPRREDGPLWWRIRVLGAWRRREVPHPRRGSPRSHR